MKYQLLTFLLDAKAKGTCVFGYGAAAKGNTLLNFAGVQNDLLPVVADRAPSKQGKFLPGSHIPVVSPEELDNDQLDVLLVFPWNLINELSEQFPDTDLVTFIPQTSYISRSS